MNNNSRDEGRRGSTTFNVVVAVLLVVVIALLFPTPGLRGNRNAVRKAQCQNNLHDMAKAIQMYTKDYDGKLPSSVLVSHSRKWNKADFLKFATKLGDLTPKGKRQTYVEILGDHLKPSEIAFCPADVARDNAGPGTQVSYWWKTALDKAWYGEGCKKPYQKRMDFAYRPDQIILYEHAGFHHENQPLRNGVGINVVYLDSRVSFKTIKNATSGDPKNCAANDDGEPMYFNYDFKRDKGMSSASVPARFVDPGVYGDRL